MLDIKFIRENIDLVKAGAKKKHVTVDLDGLLVIDDKRRALLVEVETMRAKQKATNDAVVNASPEEKERILAEMRVLKEQLQEKEKELETVMHDWQALMVQVPNIPDLSVPDGDSDADNKEVKEFTFSKDKILNLTLRKNFAQLVID